MNADAEQLFSSKIVPGDRSKTERVSLVPWFDNRDFSLAAQPSGVRFSVLRHRWMAVGGPDEAEILATGPEPALWSLVDLLRCPLKIFHPLGEPVWWGFVERVEIAAGETAYVLDLNGMANRVRAWYRPALPNSDYRLPAVPTPWADNPLSQSIYGIKESQQFLAENTAAGAAAVRSHVLDQVRYPLRSLVSAGSKPGNTASVRLFCKGWWHTTGWRTFEQPAGLAQLANPGGISLTPLGNPTCQQHLSSFTTPAGTINWTAKKVYFRLGKYGNPVDNLVVMLLDSAQNTLTSASISGADIARTGWYELSLNTGVMVSANSSYKFLIGRSGSADAANYYRIEMDTGCPGETAQYWNGSTWLPFSPPVTPLFKIAGEEDSATQLGRMLAPSVGGQFFPVVDLPTSLGVSLPMWRDGKKDARQEIEPLLQLGSGTTRYLAAVGQERRLTIYPQPGGTGPAYQLLRSGQIADPSSAVIRPGFVVAGIWMQAADIAPVCLVGPQVIDPLFVFVESMEWDNRAGRWKVNPNKTG